MSDGSRSPQLQRCQSLSGCLTRKLRLDGYRSSPARDKEDVCPRSFSAPVAAPTRRIYTPVAGGPGSDIVAGRGPTAGLFSPRQTLCREIELATCHRMVERRNIQVFVVWNDGTASTPCNFRGSRDLTSRFPAIPRTNQKVLCKEIPVQEITANLRTELILAIGTSKHFLTAAWYWRCHPIAQIVLYAFQLNSMESHFK